MDETVTAMCDWRFRPEPGETWSRCDAEAGWELTVTWPDGSGYVRRSCDEHLLKSLSVMLRGHWGRPAAESVQVSRPKNRPTEGGTK